MESLPGPYELEYFIRVPSTPNREHVFRQNVGVSGAPALGTPMSSISLLKKGGGTVAADVALNLLWSFVRNLYPTTATCFGVTLWRYQTGTLSKDFVTAATVTSPAGLSGVFQEAQQATLSFRSGNGGIQKMVFLECNLVGNTRTTLLANGAGSATEKLAAYVMSADNVTLSRDDAFAIAPLRLSLGQNEAIFRKIYRS